MPSARNWLNIIRLKAGKRHPKKLRLLFGNIWKPLKKCLAWRICQQTLQWHYDKTKARFSKTNRDRQTVYPILPTRILDKYHCIPSPWRTHHYNLRPTQTNQTKIHNVRRRKQGYLPWYIPVKCYFTTHFTSTNLSTLY